MSGRRDLLRRSQQFDESVSIPLTSFVSERELHRGEQQLRLLVRFGCCSDSYIHSRQMRYIELSEVCVLSFHLDKIVPTRYEKVVIPLAIEGIGIQSIEVSSAREYLCHEAIHEMIHVSVMEIHFCPNDRALTGLVLRYVIFEASENSLLPCCQLQHPSSSNRIIKGGRHHFG